ncbi:hypothetical protein NEOLEDRAFT_1130681 [Neolentinus lepideus HHB14362 ss-1]|uniref:Uncharacterized protein n=1 Tax=Neolentinus lepideus HHB14362 ss-1 TaxID=1314782 RepID=A0A165U4V3_9AGAM|nr:hypothetical protein NEOLEDRAFT_1130681 [Neolentinus lepideus HHB14362 ss-1]
MLSYGLQPSRRTYSKSDVNRPLEGYKLPSAHPLSSPLLFPPFPSSLSPFLLYPSPSFFAESIFTSSRFSVQMTMQFDRRPLRKNVYGAGRGVYTRQVQRYIRIRSGSSPSEIAGGHGGSASIVGGTGETTRSQAFKTSHRINCPGARPDYGSEQ